MVDYTMNLVESSVFRSAMKLKIRKGILLKYDNCKSLEQKFFKNASKHERPIGLKDSDTSGCLPGLNIIIISVDF